MHVPGLCQGQRSVGLPLSRLRGLSVYPPGRVGIAPDFHVLTKFLVADRPPLR